MVNYTNWASAAGRLQLTESCRQGGEILSEGPRTAFFVRAPCQNRPHVTGLTLFIECTKLCPTPGALMMTTVP